MIKVIKRIVGITIRFLYRICYRCIPCDDKMILFLSFHGRGYSDNPKALHQYITNDESYKEYTLVWAIKKHKEKNLDIRGAKIIEYFSISYFYYLARSKYWIVNCKLPNYVLKKDTQVYLQTWHGTPLKKLAHDIDVDENTTFYRSGMTMEQMHTTYDVDVAKYNYMISPSSFTTKVFQSAFKINGERLIETGYPRNDNLSTFTAQDVKTIKEQYRLPKDKKIILYAPTWRDNCFVLEGYTFSLEVDFSMWREKLGDAYIILFKPHYLIINNFDIEQYLGFVYLIDANKDISDLYIISDVLITDYSSVFFDYAILKRPIYFYMYDLESYKNELRGFYLDIVNDLPGDIFEQENTLLEAILGHTYDYLRLVKFNQRFNNHEDGKASERVMDIVLKQGE